MNFTSFTINPLRTKGGSNLTPTMKNGFFNFRFFHIFKRNFKKKINLYISTVHILHLVCFLSILNLNQLNYNRVSKHSENHLKRVGSERVKVANITSKATCGWKLQIVHLLQCSGTRNTTYGYSVCIQKYLQCINLEI